MSEALSAAEISAALNQLGQFGRAFEAAAKIAGVVADGENRLAEIDAAINVRAAQASELNAQVEEAVVALANAGDDLAKAKAAAKAEEADAKRQAGQIIADAGDRAAVIVAKGEEEAAAARAKGADDLAALNAQIEAKVRERAEADEALSVVQSQLASAQRALSELRSKVASV